MADFPRLPKDTSRGQVRSYSQRYHAWLCRFAEETLAQNPAVAEAGRSAATYDGTYIQPTRNKLGEEGLLIAEFTAGTCWSAYMLPADTFEQMMTNAIVQAREN